MFRYLLNNWRKKLQNSIDSDNYKIKQTCKFKPNSRLRKFNDQFSRLLMYGRFRQSGILFLRDKYQMVHFQGSIRCWREIEATLKSPEIMNHLQLFPQTKI